jgi:hypothetical protein
MPTAIANQRHARWSDEQPDALPGARISVDDRGLPPRRVLVDVRVRALRGRADGGAGRGAPTDHLERLFDSQYRPSMAIARRKPDPDGITTAQLAGTAGRYVSQKPLDVEAAVTELREIANGRGDLLAERAGVTLGFYAHENRDEWPRKALAAALLITAGTDLTRLAEWIAVAQERAERIR